MGAYIHKKRKFEDFLIIVVHWKIPNWSRYRSKLQLRTIWDMWSWTFGFTSFSLFPTGIILFGKDYYLSLSKMIFIINKYDNIMDPPGKI